MPTSSTSSSRFTPRRLKTLRTINAISKSKIPMPPFNPNDPFLSKLASVAASSPDTLLKPSSNPDNLPFLDIYDSPQLMANSAVARASARYGGRGRVRRPPPDLPSLLLSGRIVYIGMPLVSAVTELVLAQLMFLNSVEPEEPIYLYINSTGTTRADGETVAFETEGFAIYDALGHMKCQINTLGLGNAIGQACLLLAAGTPGRRFMMPHAKAMIQQPRVPSSGLRSASDLYIHAKESEETVATKMRRPFYMDAPLAKEFGVIDKILWRGQESLMAEVPTREDWENGTAGAKLGAKSGNRF
ncbi:ATP-dependent clp protease proteolytic subunit-related protein chloroplastic-like [Trifolium pratense]|uniref:ATP-dependent Clp protease proteolytic subunit n=1 Tax=Trifolium pratense TaxID=57577 RepID=A0A2K3MSU2_TRIPR|nr:ATP-dependent clp protease proteolytic subunit-related protein chloroplastic-like [Trifolium pratense]